MLDLEWPYKRHTAVFSGTQRYARQRGWRSIIDEFAHDTLSLRRDKEPPYDGIIARATKQLRTQAARFDIPLVNVWFSSPVCDLLPGVFPDFVVAGRLRAEHLLSRGFRNFAALASRTSRGHAVEIKEFCRVVGEAGCSCVTAKIPASRHTLKQWRSAVQAITNWMDRWQTPIGVYVGGEVAGRIVVQMCHERGWCVPEDVAIVSGHNEETLCNHPQPSLTSVELGQERIGYKAAQLLDRLINEKEGGQKKRGVSGREHIMLPPRALVVRESTDFFSVQDNLVASALAFIAAHSHRAISPKDVAQAAATSLRSLQRRFRKLLDRPIAKEILRVRIERAKRELAQTTRPLSKIAREVGFGNAMRMYEVFCREIGVPPSEYRRQR